MSAYSDKIIADGAVAYWRLDESSGTTVTSLVAGPPNGTISGDVRLSRPGALSDGNNAMSFNLSGPANGNVTIPVGSYNDFGTGPATLECWFKTTDLAGSVGAIDTNNTNNAGRLALLQSNAIDFMFRTWDSAGANPLLVTTSRAPYCDGRWHHAVGVLRKGSPNDTVEIWMDGILKNSATVATGRTITSPNSTVISHTVTDWIGDLDECAVYKIDLTPQQIVSHYELAQPRTAYAEKVIADGAVLYMRLDETSGTVANSLVGGWQGTISGGVTLNQPGALNDGNKAMQFDGASGRVIVPNGSYLNFGTGPLTVELWFRKTLSSSAGRRFFDCKSGGTATIAGIYGWSQTDTSLNVSVGNGTTTFAPSVTVPNINDGQWHHVAYVVQRGALDTINIYFDGVLRGTPTIPATGWDLTSIRPFHIACSDPPASLWFDGSIDEVAIYPTELSPTQIADHFTLRSISNQSELIPLGQPIQMSQYKIYALPHRTHSILSVNPLEYSNSVDGPWSTNRGKFARCPTTNTTVICKTR